MSRKITITLDLEGLLELYKKEKAEWPYQQVQGIPWSVIPDFVPHPLGGSKCTKCGAHWPVVWHGVAPPCNCNGTQFWYTSSESDYIDTGSNNPVLYKKF